MLFNIFFGNKFPLCCLQVYGLEGETFPRRRVELDDDTAKTTITFFNDEAVNFIFKQDDELHFQVNIYTFEIECKYILFNNIQQLYKFYNFIPFMSLLYLISFYIYFFLHCILGLGDQSLQRLCQPCNNWWFHCVASRQATWRIHNHCHGHQWVSFNNLKIQLTIDLKILAIY